MTLVAAAVCPHPPLLIPELAAGAASELDELRRRCDEAVAGMLAAGPDLVVVVGCGERAAAWKSLPAGGFPGPFAGYRRGGAAPEVPLSLAVGSWLLDRAGWTGPRGGISVTSDPESSDFVIGTGGTGRAVGMLVMGDASACRSVSAPGGFDPRAEVFDDAVATALARADLDALDRLDPDLAVELRVAGLAAWQLLASAARGREWHPRLLAHEAPYGVGYLVALWTADVSRSSTPFLVRDTGSVPLVALVGPTAAGKSGAAVDLARSLGGEVVNADAMQLYRGMDIGTAKMPPGKRGGVPHHMLDIWDIHQRASVAQYQAGARAVVEELLGRGCPVVVVGGSGLYVQALLDDLRFPGTDPRIRERLEAELREEGPAALHHRLSTLDPAAAEAILPGNGRRIVRALEVIELTGGPFTASLPKPRYHYRGVVAVGIAPPPAELDRRIEERVGEMFAAGLREEVAGLEAAGLRDAVTASRALGYRQILEDPDTAQEQTVSATRRFARRQRSWFRRDPRITWTAGPEEAVAAALSSVALSVAVRPAVRAATPARGPAVRP